MDVKGQESLLENDEFLLDNTNTTTEHVIQRLKEFSYYLIENIEANLSLCLNLLEERTVPKKSNSNAITVASVLSSPIPGVGKAIGSLIKQGEIYILDRIDKKNSRTLADLVYYFADNKEKFRQILIEASSELFYSFENQFCKLSCEGGPTRATQKIAYDAANRMLTYFLETKQNKEIEKDDFIKGAIFGDSLRNRKMMKSGRTVKHDEEKTWKTSSIYTKVGLFNEETGECFSKKETKTKVYGYRRIFTWENIKDWETDFVPCLPSYHLKKDDLRILLNEIHEYIMNKNVTEAAKLDRKKKHEELLQDHQSKHEEVLTTFTDRFKEVLQLLANNYQELLNYRQDNLEKHHEINNKLTEVHRDVTVTKESQASLQQSTEEIRNEISLIKNNQDEYSNAAAVVNVDMLKETVDNLKHNIKLDDVLKNIREVRKIVEAVEDVKEVIREEGHHEEIKNAIEKAVDNIQEFIENDRPKQIIRRELDRARDKFKIWK